MVLEYNTQKPFPQQNDFGVQLTETISFLLLQLYSKKHNITHKLQQPSRKIHHHHLITTHKQQPSSPTSSHH
ncbi:hypothetical protein MTR_8g027545 [Medicago truncatula]|uniref:Uncharacterized protein n=1 Tax=Medicago truncatula TaxID=3880 RepID=A0A072TN45_MEDTR|nr:hypothetical protein MTR_8g027545 [Medicago truncatula]